MKKSELAQIIKEEIRKVLKESTMAYGEKEAAGEIFKNTKIETALQKIKGYESIATGKDHSVYVYFTNKRSAMMGAKLLDKLVPGPDYEGNVVNDEGMWVIEVEDFDIVDENLLNNQGYAGSYYGFKSDIADSWDDINDMKSDMMKYFEALNDVQGSSKVLVQKGTKGLGGSRLVHAVADELIKIANKAKSKYND